MKVAKALATKQTVQTIYLNSNNLGPEAGKELAKSLTSNQTVQIISLHTNKLGPEAGKELAKALATHQTVQQIVYALPPSEIHLSILAVQVWPDGIESPFLKFGC